MQDNCILPVGKCFLSATNLLKYIGKLFENNIISVKKISLLIGFLKSSVDISDINSGKPYLEKGFEIPDCTTYRNVDTAVSKPLVSLRYTRGGNDIPSCA